MSFRALSYDFLIKVMVHEMPGRILKYFSIFSGWVGVWMNGWMYVSMYMYMWFITNGTYLKGRLLTSNYGIYVIWISLLFCKGLNQYNICL